MQRLAAAHANSLWSVSQKLKPVSNRSFKSDSKTTAHMLPVHRCGALGPACQQAPATINRTAALYSHLRHSIPSQVVVHNQTTKQAQQTAVRACNDKEIWVQTTDKATAITALEGGISTLVFQGGSAGRDLAVEWASLGRFRALQADALGLVDAGGAMVAVTKRVSSAMELRSLEVELLAAPIHSVGKAAARNVPQSNTSHVTADVWVMETADWKVIPAENLIALSMRGEGSDGNSLGHAGPRLFAAVGSAAEAQAMLEALEAGTAGVLLRTEDSSQVRTLAAYVAERATQTAPRHTYSRASVTCVTPLGSGHRVCVDTVVMLKPGEGMLVGSFAGSLFLVGCECEETGYVGSRAFRVNAGPVHSYVLLPESRTGYLAELASGSDVVVADVEGRSKSVIVGRAKVESRPLVLVEAQLEDDEAGPGSSVSVMLQNAETVTLLGPSTEGSKTWRSISVAQLKAGDQVYVLIQPAARHVGNAIDEHIVEK